MLKPAEKEDLNQISLTGMRALVIVCLLVEAPRSLQEIRDELLRLNILDRDSSNDILRIDLNTLRYMGWKISRASAKTDYKYVLLKQPFCLSFGDDELALLRKIYKRLRENNDINLLIKYDRLFQKIANTICDDKSKEALLGLSIFKHFDTKMVKDLMIDAEYNNIVELEYYNPAKKSQNKKQVSVQKIVFKNDKLYLYGYDYGRREPIVLNIQRILKILGRKLSEGGVDTPEYKIKYHLRSFGLDSLEPEEKIIESDENGYLIEGRYFNEFFATQRVLSFGPRCTVLEPKEFRNKIIMKLCEMREVYDEQSGG